MRLLIDGNQVDELKHCDEVSAKTAALLRVCVQLGKRLLGHRANARHLSQLSSTKAWCQLHPSVVSLARAARSFCARRLRFFSFLFSLKASATVATAVFAVDCFENNCATGFPVDGDDCVFENCFGFGDDQRNQASPTVTLKKGSSFVHTISMNKFQLEFTLNWMTTVRLS